MARHPQMMTAVAITEPGGPDVLAPEERPVPVPGEGELLVAVAAAGVNRPDVMQRKGDYPPPPGAPDIPGLEISGVVAAIGPGVERWKEGDPIVGLVAGGGYAEYCIVDGSNALPLPEPLTFIESAALPETTFTVWSNVFQRGGLRPHETFLVHGGASGIGTTAIQLAKAFGAFVIATAGSAQKCKACERLGADVAINYRKEDFVEAVKKATSGKGADVILDMVGGDYVARNYAAAAEEGRIVQIATLAGAAPTTDLVSLMRKRLTHTGSTLRARSVEFKAELARSIEESVWPLIATGRYKPVIDKIFPLAEAAQAHHRIDGGEHIGKIVLTVSD